MSDHMDRPFSRLYAQLREEAGEDGDADDEDRSAGWIGQPKLANPRRRSDAES